MSLVKDFKVLYHLTVSPIKGDSHKERLESFYAGQAENYDSFRRRLLQGRELLYEKTPCPEGGTWIDFGGGTGANFEFLGDRIEKIGKLILVDLSPALLQIAKKRVKQRAWTNVEIVEADATTWKPDLQVADTITFSYSLTMIPDWFAAINHAKEILAPGGHIGVVDFYVSRKYVSPNHKRHPWLTRNFWPTWFANDNVFLSPDHLPYLESQFKTKILKEQRAKVPYLPFAKVPFFNFIGQKPL